MKRVAVECKSVSKKSTIVQKYRENYSSEWPCFSSSSISVSHVFCNICSCDFSVAHGGRDDCRRHFESKKHKDYAKVKSNNKSISSFFVNNEDTSVMNAELLFTSFLVEHNVPLSVSDHAGNLFRAMFPDSKIAQKYGCARTKTTALVQHMAGESKKEIVACLQQVPFSLATDGSTDSNSVKLYPLVVSFFNEAQGKISVVLLSVVETSDNTGAGIFAVCNNELSSLNISWENCIAFSSDNASTMTGETKGVISFVKKHHPAVVLQGCSCHLIHLAAQKASSNLSVNVEEFLVQLFYYLEKSSKRKNTLKVYQEVCDLKFHKILKYASTRWLSLLDSVARVLEQWEALELLFCSGPLQKADSSNKQHATLRSLMQDPVTKLYCYFLQSVLPIFNSVNVYLQQEAPVIHILRRKLVGLLTDLLVRFIKPCALQLGTTSVTDVEFQKAKNQKSDSELVIGAKTRVYLKEKSVNDGDIRKFYISVREFYVAACVYILKKFPLTDEFLKHAEVVDISLRQNVSYTSVEYFVCRFPKLIDESQLDRLEEEFAAYQFENFADDIVNCSRPDVCWWKISQLKNDSGQMKYGALSKIMFAVLTVPHSNASTERIFSSVRKNHTEFRPSLSTESLSALLVQKVKTASDGDVCFKKKFSQKQLQAAKHATKQHLTSKE